MQFKENVEKQPSELKCHPLNQEIFDNLSGERKKILVESIKKRGVLHPIVLANDGKTIISGHQRWIVAKELNLDKIPCRIADVSPESAEATLMLIEANVAQRNLSPESYVKSLEIYKEATPVEGLQYKLIPELWNAFRQGKLKIYLAHALAKFPREEQSNFLALIGAKIEEAHHTKVQVIQKALEEEKKMLAETNQMLKVKDEEIKGLKEKIMKMRTERERIKGHIEELVADRERLMERIRRFDNEVEDLRRNPPPEFQKKIDQKQKEIEMLKGQQEEKERMIEVLKRQMGDFKENADNLYAELEKERQAKRRMEAEFRKELNEKIAEIKKKYEEQKKDATAIAPIYVRYSALLDTAMGMLEEIIGNVEEFSQEEKKMLSEKVDLLKAQTDNVIDALLDRPIRYDYE